MSTTNERLASRSLDPITIDPNEVLNVPTGLVLQNGNPARPWFVQIDGPCPFLKVLQTNNDGSFDVWNPTENQVNFEWRTHHLHSEEREPIEQVNTVPVVSSVPPPESICQLPNNVIPLLNGNWGDVIFRGETEWEKLPAGNAGEILQTQGADADPRWSIKHGSGASNPGPTNDISEGYSIFSRYLNTTTGKIFSCSDPAAAAAIWNMDSPTESSILLIKNEGDTIIFDDIPSALAAADSRDIVEVGPGIHFVTAPLDIPSQVTLKSQGGGGQTTLAFTSGPFTHLASLDNESRFQGFFLVNLTDATVRIVEINAVEGGTCYLTDLIIPGDIDTNVPLVEVISAFTTLRIRECHLVGPGDGVVGTLSDTLILAHTVTPGGTTSGGTQYPLDNMFSLSGGATLFASDIFYAIPEQIPPQGAMVDTILFCNNGVAMLEGCLLHFCDIPIKLNHANDVVLISSTDIANSYGAWDVLGANPGSIGSSLRIAGGVVDQSRVSLPVGQKHVIAQANSEPAEEGFQIEVGSANPGNALNVAVDQVQVFNVDHAGKMEILSSVRGDILYRGASRWERLSAGILGQVLEAQGPGADPIWASLSAMIYGEMFADAEGVATTITVTNTWVEVTNGIIAGQLKLVTFDVVDKRLVVPSAGSYQLIYAASLSSASANQTFEHGLGVNGSPVRKSVSQRRYSSSDIGVIAGSAILNLSANDEIGFFVRNQTSTANITVRQLNVQCHKLDP